MFLWVCVLGFIMDFRCRRHRMSKSYLVHKPRLSTELAVMQWMNVLLIGVIESISHLTCRLSFQTKAISPNNPVVAGSLNIRKQNKE